jgi:cell division protein FtsZ
LISIPNDRLLYVAPRNLPLEVAFRLADDVLRQAVQGISELITEPGLINVDFAHIRRLMQLGGGALMSIGQGQGANKTKDAIEQALHHPLLETVSLDRSAGIIANFTGGPDLTLFEVEAALNRLQEMSSSQAEIVLGVIHDERMQDRTQVILVITGLGATTLEEAMSGISLPVEKPVTFSRPPEAVAGSPLHIRQEIVQPTAVPTQMMAVSSMNDLDLPAFLRRRTRFAG